MTMQDIEDMILDFVKKNKKKSKKIAEDKENAIHYGFFCLFCGMVSLAGISLEAGIVQLIKTLVLAFSWFDVAFIKMKYSNDSLKLEKKYIEELDELKDILEMRTINNLSKEKQKEKKRECEELKKNSDKNMLMSVVAMIMAIGGIFFLGEAIITLLPFVFGISSALIFSHKTAKNEIKQEIIKKELGLAKFKDKIISKNEEKIKLKNMEKVMNDEVYSKEKVNENFYNEKIIDDYLKLLEKNDEVMEFSKKLIKRKDD